MRARRLSSDPNTDLDAMPSFARYGSPASACSVRPMDRFLLTIDACRRFPAGATQQLRSDLGHHRSHGDDAASRRCR